MPDSTPASATRAELRTAIALVREALLRPIGPMRSASELLVEVAQISGRALGTRRTSLWVFDEARTQLVCRIQLESGVEVPSRIVALDIASVATYVAAVRLNGTLMVDDARADPRVAELNDYLVARDIGALLDIALVTPGEMLGLVCHEHVGGPRAWTDDEADFAANVAALVAIALEAERRVSAERAMAGTEARYRHLVESLPVTVYAFSAETGAFDYLSPHIVKFGGWSADQWIAAGAHKAWLQAVEAPYRERVQARLTADLDRGIEEEIEYRVSLPDGSRRWVRDTCTIVRDVLGRPVAVQGMLADITAQKAAEGARDAIEKSLHDLLQNAELISIVLDPEARVRFVNPYFLRLSGLTAGEVLGVDWIARVVPAAEQARVRVAFDAGLRGDALTARYENSITTKAGTERRILWSNALLRDADGVVTGLASLGLDITERVARESAELQTQKLESLGRLAAHVAHDIDNLLTIMHGAVSDLTDPELIDGARVELTRALDHTGALVRSLLDYGRREESAPDLVVGDDVLQAAWPLASGLARGELALTFEPNAPGAAVIVDPTQLKQVLLNLVANAIDATRGVGTQVTVATRVLRIDLDQARDLLLPTAGDTFVLAVSDDGSGMDDTVRARATDPFYTTKPAGEGTGLGLAICAGVAQRAGGGLHITSAPGRGTTIELYLPVARTLLPDELAAGRAAHESGHPNEARADGAGGPDAGPSVLVVEDQPAIRSLVRRVLERHGYGVLEAGDAASAEAAIKAHPSISLVIADGRLPDGNGVDLARALRHRGIIQHVIIISGEPVRERWPGLDAILPKPFSPVDLLAVVQRVLAPGA